MKYCIVILTHLDKDNVYFFKKYNEQFADTKVIWRTNEVINDKDIHTIDINQKVIWYNTGKLYTSALKWDYDYYICIEYDTVILNDFIDLTMNFSYVNSVELSTSKIQNKQEHRKMKGYMEVEKAYGIKQNDIKWCIDAYYCFSKQALKYYSENMNPLVHSEVDIVNCLNKYRIKENPFIDHGLFTAKALDDQFIYTNKDKIKSAKIVHAIKDYKLIKYFSNDNASKTI